MRLLLPLCLALFLPASANADEYGTLNPEEMSFNSVMEKVARGEVDMVTCSHGYHITKAGRHVPARQLLEQCAEAGYTGAMTWMAQLTNNGHGGPEDPAAAAAWDKRAAEAGDPIGQFNYGLDLLRGHGVPRDAELGRRYVDQAAEAGLPVARSLQDEGYDPAAVTPDADDWKYQRLF